MTDSVVRTNAKAQARAAAQAALTKWLHREPDPEDHLARERHQQWLAEHPCEHCGNTTHTRYTCPTPAQPEHQEQPA